MRKPGPHRPWPPANARKIGRQRATLEEPAPPKPAAALNIARWTALAVLCSFEASTTCGNEGRNTTLNIVDVRPSKTFHLKLAGGTEKPAYRRAKKREAGRA